MPTYFLSDLHLHDAEQRYLFSAEKESAFVCLAKEIHERAGEMVLAGDIFDLTGMTPPLRGLDLFFAEVLPPEAQRRPEVIRASVHRSIPEMLEALKASFPRFFEALSGLARERRVTFMPGNHDCVLKTLEGRQALDQMIGVPLSQTMVERVRLRGFLLAAHGNQFEV